MIIAIFSGASHELASWETLVGRYGEWLGLKTTIRTQCLVGQRQFSLCLFGERSGEELAFADASSMAMWSSGEIASATSVIDGGNDLGSVVNRSSRNNILIRIRLEDKSLQVAVPPATPEQFYFAEGGDTFLLANDLRLMAKLTGAPLSTAGVYSLFQFLTVPAPFTVFEDIHRIPGGPLLEVFFGDPETRWSITILKGIDELLNPRLAEHPAGCAESSLIQTLDSAIEAAPLPKTLLFSGGVDSSLLLVRLLESDSGDFETLNFSFGDGDPESQLAAEIAHYLGVRSRSTQFLRSEVGSVLEQLIRDYSYPFGDISVVPTNMLVHAAMRFFPDTRSVIDGAGADGLFVVGDKHTDWRRIYRFPRITRSLVSELYRRGAWWEDQSGAELLGRLARRSVQLPIHQAAIMAQNALNGIAYRIPPMVDRELSEVVDAYLMRMASKLPGEEQMSLVDVMHVCAGQFATKTFDPLRHYGVQTVYPYLNPEVIRYSFSLPWRMKSRPNQSKAILKELLARTLPREFIYRPKSGFNPPTQQILASDTVREFVYDVVMSEANVLLSYCDVPTVEQVMERVTQGKPTSTGVYNFAWVLIFTSAWLAQLSDLRLS